MNRKLFSGNFTAQNSPVPGIPGGTGLGLAIAEQIVELHHGEIRVKSDLQGTVFEVELPMRQGEKGGNIMKKTPEKQKDILDGAAVYASAAGKISGSSLWL